MTVFAKFDFQNVSLEVLILSETETACPWHKDGEPMEGNVFKYIISVHNPANGVNIEFDYHTSLNDCNSKGIAKWEREVKARARGEKPFPKPVQKHLDAEGLKFALNCFANDASSGEMSIDEFCDYFGYNGGERKISEILKIHRACQRAKSDFDRLEAGDIYDLLNEMSDLGFD